MADSAVQANNVAVKFKGKLGNRVRKARKKGLISDRALANLKHKENRK